MSFCTSVTFWTLATAIIAVSTGIVYLLDSQSADLDPTYKVMAENIEAHQTKFREMNRTAFVLGYTGEVGKELVKELARTKIFSKVSLIGRREVKYDDPDIQQFEQKVIDFEKLEDHADAFNADVGFCCLGTTRGKSGADGFVRVDHDYVVNTAKLAKEGGCKHMSLVSSQGANKNAWFLYTKTKGKAEAALKSLAFDRLTITRPALLMCDREESRPAESLLRTIAKPMQKYFPTVATTPCSVVASAMVNDVMLNNGEPVVIMENKDIYAASGNYKKSEAKK